MDNIDDVFTEDFLNQLMPAGLADDFFEALYGDASEGAYDIKLAYDGFDAGKKRLRFSIQLIQRPGKCLTCNLTYGLPQVFSRHPLIDISGLVARIEDRLAGSCRCGDWSLGGTRTESRDLHSIPLEINLLV